MSTSLKRERSWDLLLSIGGICAAALTFVASLYLSGAVHSALERLQTENSVARVSSVLQAVDQNTHHLGDYTAGYAMWDDGYQFMETHDPAFLETNYAESVLAATPVQLVAIFTLEGKLVFSTALDEDLKTTPVPASLKDLFGLEGVADLRQPGDFRGRIEWLGDRAYLLAICPITDSAGTAPIRGYLLFGVIIGEKMLARVERLTGSKVSVGAAPSAHRGDFQINTPDLGLAEVSIEVVPDGKISKARAVFREDNDRQHSVIFDVALPVEVTATGNQIDRMIRAVFLLVAAGFVLFMTLSIREVFRRHTEIKRRIQEGKEMQVAREKAESADRAKSAFLAMISHEIRTPLNAIVGYADLLRHNPSDDLATRLEIISKSGVLLQRILDDILDFSKIEAGKLDIHPRPTDIRQLIKDVVNTFQELARARGNRIVSEVHPAVPEFLQLDDLRVRQVLANLVSNAVKFTPGGTIFITAGEAGGGTPPEARPAGANFTLQIAVEDEGIGVAENEESALFEPFSQADSTAARRYEGTGLGLVICRRLCTLMGGHISFQRRPAGGSRFAFSLPSQSADRPAETVESGPLSPGERRNDLSILIVDDSPVNARLLEAILKRTGRSADIALSATEAIELFRKNPPDVIFMDIHMPGMDGMAAARQIRTLEAEMGRPACIIIAVTADTLVAANQNSPETGMDGHLTKPLKIADLSRTLAWVREKLKR